MDPLFERRELTKKVHIDSKYLQRNIQSSLLAQLKNHYQGRCLAEGYIHPDSFTILKCSVGRSNYLRGGVDYDVTFQADVCLPHPGQHYKGDISLKSKIGLHIELDPLKVLILRDLHLGNPAFEAADVGQTVEFEVIGSQFKQGDETIVVVAKLVGGTEPEQEQTGGVVEDIPAIPKQQSHDSDVMNIVIPERADDKPKKRKLKQKPDE
jgi:DNA-directed RNA polymerase subunit E'/Rpb7